MLQATARRNGSHLGSASSMTVAMLVQRQLVQAAAGSRGYAAVAPGLRYRKFSRANSARLGASRGGAAVQLQQPIPLQLLQARFQSTQTETARSGGSSQAPLNAYGSAGKQSKSASPSSSSSATKASTSNSSEKPVSAATEASSKDAAISSKDKSSSASSSSGDSKEVSKPKDPLMTRVWAKVKHEASHYWSGTKLLGKEIKISARLQMKLLKGKSLTRREKRQVSLPCPDQSA